MSPPSTPAPPKGPPPPTPPKRPPQTPSASVAGAATVPAVGNLSLTMDQFKLYLEVLKAGQQSKPTLTQPRVGGVDSIGVWTGYGADADPSQPKSEACYREYAGSDPLKSLTHRTTTSKTCRAGLSGHPSGMQFATKSEPNSDQFVTCLQMYEQVSHNCGFGYIFKIVLPNGTECDMFKSPGLVTTDVLTRDLANVQTNELGLESINPGQRRSVELDE